MAVVSKPESKVEWTIAQLQSNKAEQRKTWTQEFETNADAAAKAIANAILPDLVEHLHNWLGDAYRPDPSSSEKLMRVYSLSLPDSASQVKGWMGEAANLEPFASWFKRFEEPAQKGVEVGSEYSKVVSIHHSSHIDKEFFRSIMTKVGQQVAVYLKEELEKLQKIEGNEDLRSHVEWFRTEEQASMSSIKSSGNNNSVKVSLWLEKQQEQSSGWSLFGYKA